MTQPNTPSTGFPGPAPAQPWLDRLRLDDAPARADFTRGVLAAWDKEQDAAPDAPRTPEPWLEHLAASAHAPKSDAFVQRTVKAFASLQTHRRVRRRVLGRLAFGAAALAAAVALAVGLNPWETPPPAPTFIPAPVALDAQPPVVAAGTGSLIAPLQASAQNWWDRQNHHMRQQVTATLTSTLVGAQTKTRALLADYAVPVQVSRLLLAPVMPALVPAAPAVGTKREDPPSPSSGLMVRPERWLA